MTIEIVSIDPAVDGTIPFAPHETPADGSIRVRARPDADAVADGETEPFGWFDIRDIPNGFDRLIDGDATVLDATEFRIVLDYPLSTMAVCHVRTDGGEGFPMRDLLLVIGECYRAVYRAEERTQSEPTPPLEERVFISNRPRSDGVFGIWGHDLDDLAVSRIAVHRVEGAIWLTLMIES